MKSHVTLIPEDVLGPLNEVERRFAPRELFLVGRRELLETGRRVAVVGSRKASAVGLQRARILATTLARHGITVVSGLAEGVDTAAHVAALQAPGSTIAVVGTPLTSCYPRANLPLQELLMAEHLVVSQFAPGTRTHRSHFPLRNRTMALLSDATVIVEAEEESGTVHQGWEALRLGRPLFLLESLAARTDLTWTKELLHHGAHVLSRDNLLEVLDELPERVRVDAAAF